jgi:hypothetical protein
VRSMVVWRNTSADGHDRALTAIRGPQMTSIGREGQPTTWAYADDRRGFRRRSLSIVNRAQ